MLQSKWKGSMEYREFGNTGIKVSALGLGANRFKVNTEAEIAQSVELVSKAIQRGINYIDSSYTYSKGKAEEIIKTALRENSAQNVHMVVKSAVNIDKTRDDVLRRIENSLDNLGIEKASFFMAWTISSYEEYLSLMKKGGYYEGAMCAKERGLVGHICFSTHCTPEDTIKIIREGAFEGVTLNYSVLNHDVNNQILEEAEKYHIGVATMSSLGTGTIPKNPEFFEFLKLDNDLSVGQAALRFVASQPAVSTTLAGVSTMVQLEENVNAFSADCHKNERSAIVLKRFREKENYCNDCGKCRGICSVGLPLNRYLLSYNARYFSQCLSPAYNRTEQKLLEDIEIFKKMKQDYAIIPDTIENPCNDCGKCVGLCPQGIDIKTAIGEIYKKVKERNFSREKWMERLDILNQRQYKKVGFYPAGGYTGYVLNYFVEFFGKIPFDIVMFDSNPKMWGKTCFGRDILPPQEITREKPDCILITNYIYLEEIFCDLKKYEQMGIEILPLHEKQDVPWVF